MRKRPRDIGTTDYASEETSAWYKLASRAATASQSVETLDQFETHTEVFSTVYKLPNEDADESDVKQATSPINILWMYLFFIQTYTNKVPGASSVVKDFISELCTASAKWEFLEALIPHLTEMEDPYKFNSRIKAMRYETYEQAVVKTVILGIQGAFPPAGLADGIADRTE